MGGDIKHVLCFCKQIELLVDKQIDFLDNIIGSIARGKIQMEKKKGKRVMPRNNNRHHSLSIIIRS